MSETNHFTAQHLLEELQMMVNSPKCKEGWETNLAIVLGGQGDVGQDVEGEPLFHMSTGLASNAFGDVKIVLAVSRADDLSTEEMLGIIAADPKAVELLAKSVEAIHGKRNPT